jgi:hypothetical protein
MRYRLRTLLIAIAVISLPLARMAYLKQMANSHRRKVAELVHKLAVSESASEFETQNLVEHLAAADSAIRTRWTDRTRPHVNIFFENGGGPGSGAVGANPDTVADWCAATYHEVMANRYDRAVFRPWTIVAEPSLPNEH